MFNKAVSSENVFKTYFANSVNLTLNSFNYIKLILSAMVFSTELVLEDFFKSSDLTTSATAKVKFCYYIYDKSPHIKLV